MVAPTRTPQTRGVKCDLCKKILASATWLDQTKLAKNVNDAQTVLHLIKQHESTGCPCIPKNIENLLVGSTHFEIHRLIIKCLDIQVHENQYDFYSKAKQKVASELSKNEIINDCNESAQKTSRFKVYHGYNDQKHSDRSKQHLKHLVYAVDFWKLAMEDQANPFNPKLALRLGLTHHVIYACYLFKYYKILDYQLLAANLLLNLFKSIEGVTANAVLHANYLLVKSLIDCNQLQQARQCLKQATRINNYHDKSHYESILLTCASCELSLLDNEDIYSVLDELASLAVIQADDKLQHYYARTLAVSLLVKYIHCYPARSDHCYEFYHTFRYIGAIIRRCYENSFDLVLSEKDLKQTKQQQTSINGEQKKESLILDHSWIRFAVCDFAFSTFDLLSNFYIRTGQPENMELLYNGLNLVAYRNCSCYWQSRMAIIGANLDLLCDKYDDARAKLDVVSRVIGHESDPHLMNLLRLDLEVSLLSLLDQQQSVIHKELVMDLLQRLKTCQSSFLRRICKLELFDCHLNTFWHTLNQNSSEHEDFIVIENNLGQLSLRVLKVAVQSMLRDADVDGAKNFIYKLGNQFDSLGCEIIEYHSSQIIEEIMICFADIDKSDQLLLDAISSSHLFIESSLLPLESQLSSLTLDSGDTESIKSNVSTTKLKKSNKVKKVSRLKGSRSKRTYHVALESKEKLNTIREYLDTIDAVKNFNSLSQEEIITNYLKNSQPNPDYLIYRRAHELMFCLRLKDENRNHEQLLYHFSESAPHNTMRYRWMMFEEQQASPFELAKTSKGLGCMKQLGFSGIITDKEHNFKSIVKTIPNDYKLVQLKYIINDKTQSEHLLVVCFDGEGKSFYLHTKQPISSDDFFENASKQESDLKSLTTPNRFSAKVEEAKKTLLNGSQKSRSELRQKLEKELGLLLNDLENDWLGPFRFLLCGEILDTSYSNFIDDLVDDIGRTMEAHTCVSSFALRSFLENAALLNRDEFCQLTSSLYNCPSTSDKVRDCFNIWLKKMEKFVFKYAPNSNKTTFLQSASRGQLGLILDKDLEHIPFESLPIVRITKQGIFRVPSLRIFSIISSRNYHVTKAIDSSETVYILDPANNLAKTRERFENKLKAQKSWVGTISEPPTPDQLEQWFSTKQIYIFIGHGAGTAYYNRLCKNRGLSAMTSVKPISIVMGCSSGRMLAEGPRLESFGISWVFILRGSSSYVGLLWDVTDTDIDKFLDSLLEIWMRRPKWCSGQFKADAGTRNNNGEIHESYYQTQWSIAEAVAQARLVCQFKFLVGSTPVTYGLPVWCK